MDNPENTLGISESDEAELEALVSDFRTLCGVQLPGDYSSDAALQAAMIYWQTQKLLQPPRITIPAPKPHLQFRERTLP